MPKCKRVGGRQKGVNRAWETRFSEEEIRALARRNSVCSNKETGRILGIHEDTVGKLAREGKLPSYKRGNRRIYNVREIAALIGVQV